VLDVVADWLASQRSAQTRRAYTTAHGQWERWLAGRKKTWRQATRADVEQWLRSMEGAGGYRPKTVAARLSAIRSLYQYAVEVDALDRSPVTHVRTPHIDDELVHPSLSLEQLRALVHAAGEINATVHALVRLLADNGLRIGETVSANVEDLTEDGGRRVLQLPHRKGGKAGQAVLHDRTADALSVMLDGRSRGPLFIRPGRPQRTLVELEAARMTRDYAARLIARACKRARVPVVPPHGLRRSFATAALDAGAALIDVQDAMGHRSADTTRIYDQRRGRLERAPSLVVAEALEEP